MDNSPLVSIIMPAHNAAGFISQSIESVLSQTYPNWELLIIDDASGDNTSGVVNKYESFDSRIKLHVLPTNQGAGFARNIGIKAAQGDYISFLDADDLWEPRKLEEHLEVMQKNNYTVSFSTYELIDETGRDLHKQVKALEFLSFKKLKRANYIGNLTGVYNSKALGKIYCPLIRKRQDWGLWLLAVKKGGGAIGIQKSLAKYRVRKNSISGNKVEMLKYNFQVYRKVLQYTWFKSFYWLLLFLWEQLVFKKRQTIVLK